MVRLLTTSAMAVLLSAAAAVLSRFFIFSLKNDLVTAFLNMRRPFQYS